VNVLYKFGEEGCYDGKVLCGAIAKKRGQPVLGVEFNEEIEKEMGHCHRDK